MLILPQCPIEKVRPFTAFISKKQNFIFDTELLTLRQVANILKMSRSKKR